MSDSKLLTADPKEHLKTTKILLEQNDDSLLRYAALEPMMGFKGRIQVGADADITLIPPR